MRDFKNIYSLDASDDYAEPAPECDQIPFNSSAIARGELPWPSAMRLILGEGSGSAVDMMGTSWAAPTLISARVVESLLRANITGWHSTPVTFAETHMQHEFHALSVVGRCASIDDSASPIVTRMPHSPRGIPKPYRVGIYFAVDSWDGSDVFTPGESTWIFVVQKVKQLLEDMKATNVCFRPLTEIQRMVLPNGTS